MRNGRKSLKILSGEESGSDPESTCGSGSPPEINHLYRVTPCTSHHVWATSVTAIVTYCAHRTTERRTDRITERTKT